MQIDSPNMCLREGSDTVRSIHSSVFTESEANETSWILLFSLMFITKQLLRITHKRLKLLPNSLCIRFALGSHKNVGGGFFSVVILNTL